MSLTRQGFHLQFNTNIFINIMLSHKIEFSTPCIVTAIKMMMPENACTQTACASLKLSECFYIAHTHKQRGILSFSLILFDVRLSFRPKRLVLAFPA